MARRLQEEFDQIQIPKPAPKNNINAEDDEMAKKLEEEFDKLVEEGKRK